MSDVSNHLLKLPSGKVLNPATGQVSPDTEVNEGFTIDPTPKIKRSKPMFDGASRRYLDDLRMPALQSRPYMIILGYSLFGLTDADIAAVLKVSADDVRSYKNGTEYEHLLDCVLANVREHDKDKVRKRLNASAELAADKVASLMDSEDAAIALRASQDILNRTGHAATESTASQNDTGITIRILNDRDVKTQVDVGV